MMRLISFFTIILSSLLIIGCSTEKKNEAQSMNDVSMVSGNAAAGGIDWSIPSNWKTGADKSMRIVTYIIDPADGDIDSAECAVFYFGASSGGGTQANIERWASQFEQPDGNNSLDQAKLDTYEKDGLKISTIDLKGTYLVSGAMMQVSEKKDNYRILGAIAEGPQGSVFFKFTGQENTIAKSESEFKALLKSIKIASNS